MRMKRREPRSESASSRIESGDLVGVRDRNGGESEVKDGLFLGHDFLHANDFVQRGNGAIFRRDLRRARERARRLRRRLARPVFGRRRAGDREDEVLGQQARRLVGGDVLERDRLDALDRAQIFAAIGMARIKRGAHEIARGRHGIIEFGLEKGKLFAFFRLQFAFRRCRLGQHFEEEIEARLPVGTEQFERKRGAVVAGVGMERTAELFDVAGELLGVAAARSLHEQIGGEAAEAGLARGFGQQAAGQGGAEGKERQRVLRHVEGRGTTWRPRRQEG